MNMQLGNKNINVIINYKNNKNIYFRFDEEMNLVVTCPKKTPDYEISKLISKNEEALLKMYEKSLEKAKYDSEFWYLGKKYNEIIQPSLYEVTFKENNVYIPSIEAKEDFLKRKIEEIFTKETELCKKCFSRLPDFKLRFRKMKTRWGVCNTKDKIVTLNTELIKKDIDLLDYVIIHELSHFFQGNHSKKFWDIVQQACPNYKERRARLRK